MRVDLKVAVLMGEAKIVTVEAETVGQAINEWHERHPNDLVIAWRETPDDAGNALDAQ